MKGERRVHVNYREEGENKVKQKKFLLMSLMTYIVLLFTSTITVEASESWLWPVAGYTSTSRQYSADHKGIDITAPGIRNQPVRAAKSGIVIYSSNSCPHYNEGGRTFCGKTDGSKSCNGGCGNYVYIDHGDGTRSRYMHLIQGSAIASGQRVSRGQIIGRVGSSGWSTGTHLHFEIWKNGVRTNNSTSVIGYDYGSGSSSTPSSSYQHNPTGCLDAAEGRDGKVYIRGWALDYDVRSNPLEIHVYIGGTPGSSSAIEGRPFQANKSRPDVPTNLGDSSLGNNHGFEEEFSVGYTGTYPIYVYGINQGARDSANCNTLLGSSVITIRSAVQTCSVPNISFNDIVGGKQLNITAGSGETVNYEIKRDGISIGSGSAAGSYTATFAEAGNYEVAAYATKSGNNNSGTQRKNTTVSKAESPTVIQSVTGTGVVLNMQSSTQGATIYYTTSGNTPTVSSSKYTGAVIVDSEKTIKAIAVKPGYLISDVSETPIKLSVPPAPTGLKLTCENKLPVGENATVSWDSEAEAASYNVALYKDGKEISNTTTSGTTATLNLPSAGKYQIKIYAINFVGNSVESDTIVEVEAMNPLTVEFVDWDGSLIKSQEVPYGKDAELPEDPYRRGYTFRSWNNGDKITGIKENLTVTAEYKINTYTIRFFDASMNQVGASQKVNYGEAAVSPEDKLTDIPTGYVFAGWKVIECANDSQCDYQKVDSDMKLQAVYYWENEDLPIVNEITSATWDAQTGNYKISVKLTNYPTDITTALLRVSLYTSQGKMVKSTKTEFDVQADGTSEKEITLKYGGTATVAKVCTLGINGNDLTGSALSKEASSKIKCLSGKVWTDWSEWGTTAEEASEGKEVEKVTQYRYADKVTTTSSASSMAGWTLSKTSQYWSDWGGWSGWSETPQSGSDSRQVETRTVYRYYCFYCPVCGGREPFQGKSDCGRYTLTLNNAQVTWSTVPYSACNPQGYSYTTAKKWTTSLGDGQRWNFSTQNLNDTAVGTRDAHDASGAIVIQNQYRYRTRNLNTTYYYYKWNNWSDWSENAVTESDSRKVETRTLYRSRTEVPVYDDLTGTEEQGTSYTISGKLKFTEPDLKGKLATVMVYKGKNADPNEDQIQYISQTTIGEGNTYSFTIIAKADPTILSGDYTVCLGVEGATGLINVDMIQAPRAKYTVTYVDDDGSEISRQTVTEGDNAVVPESPKKDGYLFVGWSANGNNVNENMTIVAVYAPIQYVVAFVDSKNNTMSCETYNYGDEIIVPEAPSYEGCIFKGWDKILAGNTKVTGNMVINAVYEVQKFTVSFVDETGKSVSEQEVAYGECAIPPAPLDVAGKEFKGWSTEKNWWSVTEDITVEPILTFAETTIAPSYSIIEMEDAIAVFLDSDTENANIYYAYGEDEPSTDTEKYENEPVIIPYVQMESKITETDTEYEADYAIQLNAFAVSEGRNDSEVQNIVYEGQKTYHIDQNFTVTFDVNGGDKLAESDASMTVTENSLIGTLPVPTRTDYEFIGWFTKTEGGEQITEDSVIEADCTLYAHWQQKTVDENAPTITVSSAKATAGKDVTVTVAIAKNTGIAGYSYDINYDETAMSLKSITAGDLLAGTGQISTNGNVVNWYTADNVPGDGILMKLVFTVDSETKDGTYPVSVSLHDGKKNLVDEKGNFINANYVAGQIEVTSGMLGDLNGDEDVTIADVVILNRHVLGKEKLTDAQLAFADVNGDGDVTIADVVVLNRVVLGKESLTATESLLEENEMTAVGNNETSPLADASTSESEMQISVKDVEAEPGATVDVPVYLSGNTGMAGFALTVDLPEGYTLNSVKAGDMLAGGIFSTYEKSCTWYTSDNIVTDGLLLTLNVTVPDTAGSGQIAIGVKDGKVSNLSNEKGQAVAAKFTAGNVTVKAALTECDKNGHKGGKATCVAKAICEVCGKEYGELNLNNHTGNTEVRNKVAATCTEKGYSGDRYCRDCGAELQKGKETAALGHDFGEWKIIKKETCVADGYKVRYCNRDSSHKETATIPQTGHRNTEYRGIVKATCIQEGYSGDLYCKECGMMLRKGEKIAKKEHSWNAGEVTVEPTTTTTGTRTYTCTECGTTKTEEIPMLDSNKIALKDCNIQLTDTAYIADGTEKKPSVTVTYNDTTLVEGTDYTVEYANNINPGTATVTIIAAADSNYTGIAQLTFEIKPVAEEAPVVIQPNAFSNCANLVNANIKESVTEIGDEAFADCKNLLNIYFYGNCPKFGKAVFKNVTATAYYPYADNSWTLDELQNYGGNITWLPWNPETQTPEKRDLAICKINMRTSGYSYTGKAQVPEITITDGVYTLAAGKDYKVTSTDNINAGNATVTVEGTGNYGGSFRGTFVIDKAVPTLNFQNKMIEGTVADSVKYKNNLTAQETDGKITYSCDKNNIIEMFWDNNGVVISAMHAGTVTVTVKAEEGRNYLAGSTSFTVKVNKAAGKITASDITRNYSAKKQYVNTGWQSNGGRKLTYSSDNKAVKIDAKGKITIAKKFTGLATITVKASETNDYKAGSCKVAVTVKPSKTSITRVVNGAKKKATVTWKKNKTGTGYVIQYSTDKRFRKGVKTLYISKNKTTKATLSKLSKGKKYYVRIATYKVAGKNKICSSWSKVKRIKIRK